MASVAGPQEAGMNQRVICYAGEDLEAVAFALLLLALIVLAARWVNRRYR